MAAHKKPSELKLFKRPCRMNKLEPKIYEENFAPPDDYTPEEIAYWNEVYETIKPMKVLSISDRLGFESMVETYIEVKKTRKKLKSLSNATTADEKAEENIVFKKLRDLNKEMKGLIASFGMTPADRTKVQVTKQDETEDAAIFEMFKAV